MVGLSNKHPKHIRKCSLADMQAGKAICFSATALRLSLPIAVNVWMEDVS
jgi:hypothetical protein